METQFVNLTAVSELVGEIAGRAPSAIRMQDRLRDDLGLDSLQSMELLSRLTEDHGVEPAMDEVVKVVTVGDAVALVDRMLRALQVSAAAPERAERAQA